MGPIDGLTIRPVGPEAAAEGLALTVETNWNQTAEDWAFFISYGTVFGARDAASRLVATAALLPYSAGFAWIGLVIVAQPHRGRGLGTRMLNECIAALCERALSGMLDATPTGAQVYALLGFKPIMGLQRWAGAGGGIGVRAERVRLFATSDVQRIARVDSGAFGADRETLLADYCARVGTRGFELADGSGYALVRLGRVASQLGPVVAGSARDATVLLEAAIAATPGSIFIDVPDAWTEVAVWLGARGFAVQRPFVRMALGRDAPFGDPARVFAIAGPEYG